MSLVEEHAAVMNPERFISITRARLIARYRMHTIPGRPEELETNRVFVVASGTGEDRQFGEQKRIVSFGFAGGELRIRQHGGEKNRDWVDTRDFRLRDGWLADVYEYLDEFLGYVSYVSHVSVTGRTDVHNGWSDGTHPRQIRDNSQA